MNIITYLTIKLIRIYKMSKKPPKKAKAKEKSVSRKTRNIKTT